MVNNKGRLKEHNSAIIVAQILTVLVKNNKSIQGITNGDIEIKLTQFADDNALILHGNIE